MEKDGAAPQRPVLEKGVLRMKTSCSRASALSIAVLAAGWSFQAFAAPAKGRAPAPKIPAQVAQERVDDHVEFMRVATGYYDEKKPVIPMPVPRPSVQPDHVDEQTEFMRVATGYYDRKPDVPPAAASRAKARHAPPSEAAAVAAPADRPVEAANAPAAAPAEVAPSRPVRKLDLADPYKDLIDRYAAQHGLPAALAHAVVTIESGYNPMAFNAGAIGLMQILLPTARGLGYDGDRDGLHDPEVNLRYGIMYLAQAYRMSNGDTCQTVMRYQSGHYAKAPNAANLAYCEKARSLMARAG